ncbi:MAG: ABC transporter permease, partial [Spirochaetaceae bacterium]|nr:ABC transporter permease [Spirochaetaceae bacterium]
MSESNASNAPLSVDAGRSPVGEAARDPGGGRRRPLTDFFGRLLRQQPLGAAAGVVLLGLIFVAVFAEQLTPHEYDIGRVQDRLQAPSAEHPLGTDHAGRDVLARILKGAQVSLLVGLMATLLNTIVALLVGGTTGFIGGRVDIYTQRFVDAWMSFPGLLLLLTIMSFVDRSIVTVIVVLGVTGGIPASRVVRGAVIGVKENAYFQAAEAAGARRRWTLVRHVLPNIAAPLIVIFSINVGSV